jgi:hypothetical protein
MTRDGRGVSNGAQDTSWYQKVGRQWTVVSEICVPTPIQPGRRIREAVSTPTSELTCEGWLWLMIRVGALARVPHAQKLANQLFGDLVEQDGYHPVGLARFAVWLGSGPARARGEKVAFDTDVCTQ